MKKIKKIIELIRVRLKKIILIYFKRYLRKILDLNNHPMNLDNKKFNVKFSKKKPNLIAKKLNSKNFDLFEIKAPYFQNVPSFIDLNKIFGRELNLRTIKGISECFVDKRGKTFHLKGVNFSALWENNDIVENNNIYTNDIYGMMIHYGIEASRNCINNELESIFKNQGIIISLKHFDFISDYMTRLGNFRGFNRNGLNEESGFQEITYETAVNYIITSSLSNKVDDLATVSSRLSVGRLINIGTGCFGIKTK